MGDPSDFIFTGTRGFARIRVLAPGMLHGKGDEQIWDGTGLVVFYDTTGMTGFEKSFRLKMMAWQAETHGRRFQYVLVRSPIVAAAITAASKFIGGGAQITSSRTKFETLLTEAVRSRIASDASSNVQARLPRL